MLIVRSYKPPGGDLLADGWLPPRAAAAALGVEVRALEGMVKRGEIRRRALAPSVWLYEVGS